MTTTITCKVTDAAGMVFTTTTTADVSSPPPSDGWTTISPILDGSNTELQQEGMYSGPGSRMVYVAANGNDNNPGTKALPKASVAAGLAALRSGHPDQLLFRCGDTWTSTLGNLSVTGLPPSDPNGLDITGPIVIRSYIGDNGNPNRPLFKCGSSAGIGITGNNVALMGIELYAHTCDPNSPNYAGPPSGNCFGVYLNTPGSNFTWALTEDVKATFFGDNFYPQPGSLNPNSLFLHRRCINAFACGSNGVSQGELIGNIGKPVWHECFFYQSGWNQQLAAGGNGAYYGSVRNRNLYIQSDTKPGSGGCGPAELIGNIILCSSSEGVQVRPGGIAYNNLAAWNTTGLILGYDDGTGHVAVSNSSATYNIILNGVDLPYQASGPRASGIGIQNTTSNILVQHNILAHCSQSPVYGPNYYNSSAIFFDNPSANGVTVTDNIIYDWPPVGSKSPPIGNPTGSGCTVTRNLIEQGNLNTSGFQPAVTNYDLIGYVYQQMGGGQSTPWTPVPTQTHPMSPYTMGFINAWLGSPGVDGQSRNHWNPQLTASSINDKIRAIFNQPPQG